MRIINHIYKVVLIFISVLVVALNINLHRGSANIDSQKEDIILQLNFLESELKQNDLGFRMQQLFPEGYLFIHALYGLTWCELIKSDSVHSTELKSRAISEAIYAFDKINSKVGEWPFDKYLIPEYGIFYRGWKNYLLSKILIVDTTFQNSKEYIKLFKRECEYFSDLYAVSQTPYFETYFNQTWPADNFLALASLANYDKAFEPKYTVTIEKWINKVKSKVDKTTGMIPHKVDARSGLGTQNARGCSMALMLRLLAEIDEGFGQNQFDLFNEHFVTTTFGLPSIREYPKGVKGKGDIDSGPVIFGVGFSGTITSIGTFAANGFDKLSLHQYKTINAFGLSTKNKNQKKYLLGQLPMADAFIAWGRATNLKNESVSNNGIAWAIKFHLYSIVLLIILWVFHYRKRVYPKVKAFLLKRRNF